MQVARKRIPLSQRALLTRLVWHFRLARLQLSSALALAMMAKFINLLKLAFITELGLVLIQASPQ
jgi:hypothetical protein